MKTTISRDTDFRAISIAEFKQSQRIDNEGDELEDALIDGMILAATQAAEAFLDSAITPATVEFAEYVCLSNVAWAVMLPAVDAVTAVELEDCLGVRTTLVEGEDYLVDANDLVTVVRLLRRAPSANRAIVTAVVGYEDAANVPAVIKQAISVHAGSAYNGREGQDTAQLAFERLLRPYSLGGF